MYMVNLSLYKDLKKYIYILGIKLIKVLIVTSHPVVAQIAQLIQLQRRKEMLFNIYKNTMLHKLCLNKIYVKIHFIAKIYSSLKQPKYEPKYHFQNIFIVSHTVSPYIHKQLQHIPHDQAIYTPTATTYPAHWLTFSLSLPTIKQFLLRN